MPLTPGAVFLHKLPATFATLRATAASLLLSSFRFQPPPPAVPPCTGRRIRVQPASPLRPGNISETALGSWHRMFRKTAGMN